jgi:hypothetical protein
VGMVPADLILQVPSMRERPQDGGGRAVGGSSTR